MTQEERNTNKLQWELRIQTEASNRQPQGLPVFSCPPRHAANNATGDGNIL